MHEALDHALEPLVGVVPAQEGVAGVEIDADAGALDEPLDAIQAVGMLRAHFGANASAMEAFIGPAAGECCYEVGEEVAAAFANQFVSIKGGKPHISLKEANRAQLVAAGLPDASIEVHAGCTIHESSVYQSFRRDGRQSGRMVGVAGLV